jgi:hypothetical protein
VKHLILKSFEIDLNDNVDFIAKVQKLTTDELDRLIFKAFRIKQDWYSDEIASMDFLHIENAIQNKLHMNRIKFIMNGGAMRGVMPLDVMPYINISNI